VVSRGDVQAWLASGWQRMLRRLGWLGLAGALLAGLAVSLLMASDQLQRSAAQTQSAIEAERRKLAGLRKRQAAPASDSQKAEQFVEAFPSAAHSAADLRMIFECAHRAHVSLPRGEYVVKADGNAAFITYTATFPVHEPYEQLKFMAAAVLEALPHAALEELRMARSDSTGVDLDATLRFTLVYRRR
jgi:hypothetical protein